MTLFDEAPVAGASISPDGLYRYHLWRQVGDEERSMLFVMLNPSVADAAQDDATIRRCVGFARREGCGMLEVVNLFAWRATNPRELSRVKDPVGPENVAHVHSALQRAERGGVVVAAWGQWRPIMSKAKTVRHLVEQRTTAQCLGQTRSGDPRHPLYIAKSTPLSPWR